MIPARTIVFDLDGVLANSIAMVEHVYELWARELGLNVQTVIDLTHGRRKPDIMRAVAPLFQGTPATPTFDPQEQIRRLIDIQISRLSDVIPIAGAAEFLSELPSGSWAIATSGERELALGRLRQVGIAPPVAIVASEDVAKGKPDPGVYLQAARLIGASPEQCIVFEDAPLGIEGALAAGMRAIGVTTTYPADALVGVTATIPDFRHAHPVVDDGVLRGVLLEKL